MSENVAEMCALDCDRRGDGWIAGEITLHFNEMPLGAALKLIADDGGYALVRRDAGGRPRYALYFVGSSVNGLATGTSPRPRTPVGRPGNGAVPPVMPPTPMPAGGSVTVTEDGG